MTEKFYKIWGYTSHFFTQARKRTTYRLGMTNNQHGNAMIYVLIALALFGFLTLTLSRSNNQADGQDIDDEQAELYALELMEYAASAQAVVDQMLFSGSEIDDLDFVIPSNAAFNTPPHHHKVYHPQGGGLSYVEVPNDNIIDSTLGSNQWAIKSVTNVEWTATIQHDVILTAYRIQKEICEKINKSITGSISIPTTISAHNQYFLPDSGANTNLTTAECSNCGGYTNLCIQNHNTTNPSFSFYNIIAAR